MSGVRCLAALEADIVVLREQVLSWRMREQEIPGRALGLLSSPLRRCGCRHLPLDRMCCYSATVVTVGPWTALFW